MSSFLYRLGRWVAQRAKLVLVVWLVALLGSGILAVAAGGELQDDLTIPGTEAQEGIDVLERQFPEAAGTSGQVLFVAPKGEQVGRHRDEIEGIVDRLEKV
ncbi:MAG TPA: MMPL family transporter, partial [Agromyces sp.]